MRSRAQLLLAATGVVAWYPALLAGAWVLRLGTDAGVGFSDLTRSLIVVCGLTMLVALLSRLIVRDTPRSGAVAALVVACVLAAHSVVTVLPFLAALGLLLIEARFARQGRVRLPWQRIHEGVSVFALALVLIAGVQLAQREGEHPPVQLDPAWQATVQPLAPLPDFYFVLADGRGRSDVLRTLYDYDSTPLDSALTGLGFQVVADSRANYLFTELSLASFFTASQLTDLGQDPAGPVDTTLLRAALEENPTWDLLRRLGYTTIAIPSGWNHVPERSVDVYEDTGQLTELEYNLLRSTAIGSFLPDALDTAWRDAVRDRTTASVAALRAVSEASSPRPRAAFIHLPAPHPPFVLDSACGPQAPVDGWMGSLGRDQHAGTPATIRLEVEQTTCVDTLLVQAMSDLVDSDPRAVVVVFSDHGPEEHLDWWNPDATGVAERTASYLAVRTPGHEGLLAPGTTLVNVLPTLFNAYLGTDLPRRPNTSFFGPSRQDGTLTTEPGP
jgi:hypothetical protein